jgi:hypothetical protein
LRRQKFTKEIWMRFSSWQSVMLLLALLVIGSADKTFAQVINFEAQCPGGVQSSGPCSSTFAAGGPAQTLNVSTTIGTVTFQGGILLDDTSGAVADESAIYITSSFGVSGYTNPITITFPQAITNFYLTVLNGEGEGVMYTVADNNGHSSSFTLPSDTSGGEQVIGFPATGTIVTITATPVAGAFDFAIDNVTFNQPLPPGLTSTPAPASLMLVFLGLAATGFYLWWRKRHHGRIAMMALALILIPITAFSAELVMHVKGVWQLALNQGKVTLTIDQQKGSQFSGTISGDQLGGKVSGHMNGMTMIFDRTPEGRAWPADETGLQRQSFSLNLAPVLIGGPMFARGTWSGYGQGAAAKQPGGLSASAERTR